MMNKVSALQVTCKRKVIYLIHGPTLAGFHQFNTMNLLVPAFHIEWVPLPSNEGCSVAYIEP